MIAIWLVVLGITFVLCMKRTIYGCCMLVYARILIPDIVRLTPLADISLNTGIIGVIGIFLFRDLLFQKVTLNGLVMISTFGIFCFLQFYCYCLFYWEHVLILAIK